MYQHFLFKPQIDGKSNAKNSISIRFKIITNVEKKLEIGPIKENSHYSKYRPRKQEFSKAENNQDRSSRFRFLDDTRLPNQPPPGFPRWLLPGFRNRVRGGRLRPRTHTRAARRSMILYIPQIPQTVYNP